MAARYYPAAADYQKIVNWLTQKGFSIQRLDASRVAIFASGRVDQLQKGFSVSFARVSADGEECTSAISAPMAPAEVASLLVGINGLQPHIHMHRHLVLGRTNSTSGAGAPYEPSQIAPGLRRLQPLRLQRHRRRADHRHRDRYLPAMSDLTAFWSDFGVNRGSATVKFIQVVSGSLPAPSGEETLDTEWSSSIAPGADVRVYAAPSPCC